MKKLAMLIGVLAIAVIGVGPFLFIQGRMSLDAYKWAALVSTVVWFVAALWPGAEEAMEEAIDD